MEINKQLFEDILSGKLKGTFVLRCGIKISSDELSFNDDYDKEKYPYTLWKMSYTPEGYFHVGEWTGGLSIINFIPETNMKQNELTVEIPEGQEINWQESAKQKKIVFKKKDIKPRSWEEYCEQQTNNKKGYLINSYNSAIVELSWNPDKDDTDLWKNVLPSKELTEAFLAMMQLMSLRQAWIGDWGPNWDSREPCDYKYCITGKGSSGFEIEFLLIIRAPLSFPTREMAEDFMNTFKNLLETAKPLV